MIKIFAKNVDLLSISKILLSYRGLYQITSKSITIHADIISEELLKNLIQNLELLEVSNHTEKVTSAMLSDNNNVIDTEVLEQKTTSEKEVQPKFSQIQRGEVYYANCSGTQLGKRPVLIVQNDKGNKHSPYTIVIPITSVHKNLYLPTHLSFKSDNLIEGQLSQNSVLVAENIESMPKSNLISYIGKVNQNFMKEVDKILSYSVGIKPQIITQEIPNKGPNTIHETVFIDMNLEQIQIIHKIDNVSKLLEISSKQIKNKEKVKEILKLFNFDLKKNGTNYVVYAICYAPKNGQHFTLSDVIQKIPKNMKDIPDNEVQRLIIARIKEALNFKNSPALAFIRLVNLFLTKWED